MTVPLLIQGKNSGFPDPVAIAAPSIGSGEFALATAGYGYTGSLWIPNKVAVDGSQQLAPAAALKVMDPDEVTVPANPTPLALASATQVGTLYNLIRGYARPSVAGLLTIEWSVNASFAKPIAKTWAATADEQIDILHPNWGDYIRVTFLADSTGGTISGNLFAGNWVA